MNRSAQPFSVLDVPLQGTNLIEASAGTGKTWNIAALFTRLIVLEQMPVDSVLVVTFTKAATAELKSRLRGRLEEALDCLKNAEKREQADPFLQTLLAQAEAKESGERLQLRLKSALSQFDNAAIYTIHGFCQRLLRDYAFLCQAPFDMELAEGTRQSLMTPLQDFWRETVAADAEKAELAVKYGQTPSEILASMGKWLPQPMLSFQRPDSDWAAAKARAAALWQKTVPQLAAMEAAFWQLMEDTLSGTSYRRPTFTALFAELKLAAEQNRLPEADIEKLLMFDAAVMQAKSKKGKTPDPQKTALLQDLAYFGEAFAAVQAAEQEALVALQIDSFQALQTAAQAQKKADNLRNFDDLLLDVYHALHHGRHAETLAQTVAAEWQLALIDEFQDTDALQYGIFRKIFIENGRPVFLVGDPKQAIYAFRGADIATYLNAAADAAQHYTLATNFRSHTALVGSINALFRQKNKPFLLDIDYPEVAADRSESRLSPPHRAVNVRWLTAQGEELGKDALRRRAADYCADEIAGLLNQAAKGRLKIGESPLEAGQIAVLVRTANEGKMVADSLKRRRVHSVQLRNDSVFGEEEAEALAALLGFWLEPQQTQTLRFVLSGVLFGQTAADLYRLNHDEALLSDYIAAARDALADWQQYGVYTALQRFDARYGLTARLLAAGKERSLSNIRQLAELLSAEDEIGHTPASLHQWLLERIRDPQRHSGGDAAQMRLESDEALVKIVTMHAAKGLQYPVVFCPFAWDAQKTKLYDWQQINRDGEALLLHKSQISSEELSSLAAERLGEELRLLYVALTRAEDCLTVYAAPCDNTGENTFAYLLEGGADAGYAAVAAAYKDEQDKAAMLYRNWQRFLEHSGGDIGFSEDAPPEAVYRDTRREAAGYRAEPVAERAFRFVRQTSFTGLTRNLPHHAAAEQDNLLPALDSSESLPAAVPEAVSDGIENDEYSFFHFPRGAQAGVCLHELLENADFALPAAHQQEAFAAVLQRYNFDEIWLPAVSQMADTALSAALPDGRTLSQIAPEDRLSEMGFLMKMQDFDLGRLKNWLARSGLPQSCLAAAEQLDFDTLNGFLNGFVDLTVWLGEGHLCIIDYKSNHLGMRADDYHAAALDEAVAAHHYYLQALIYAVAAARYFAARRQPLATVHIRYFFLRGLSAGSEDGIWAWDIPAERLAEWL